MAYRALYRQYRPRTFSEVIGQEHITTILKNQVAAGRVAHAYLFCGTRGTGKTSTAKILARAVNCLAPSGGEPCGVCAACLSSADENAVDILELDAASNNGVDDARALIEQSQYAPMQLSRRVFIIDEAHMLTGPAFNALLKTLEEPPAHVLFILATTEPQKLPATIVSRCQRFDFRRLSAANIVQTLKSVLEKAGASIDGEGLSLIARAADGGMRDALSLADQCLSFIGDTVTKRDVLDVLGGMEESFLFDIAAALLRSDAAAALVMLDGIVRAGRDLTVFCQDLSAHVRALLLARTCGECADLLECTQDAMRCYLEQAAPASESFLLRALELLVAAQNDMRYLASPRTLLESVLVRICRPEDELSLAALAARVDRLEQGFAPAASTGGAQGAPETGRERNSMQASAPQRAAESAARQPAAKPAQAGGGAPVPVEARGEAVRPPEVAVETGEPQQWGAAGGAVRPAGAMAPGVTGETPYPGAQKSAVSASAGAVAQTLGPAGLWTALLAELYKQNILVQALARDGVPQSFENGLLSVGFDAGHGTQLAGLQAPINFNKMQSILTGLSPNTRLLLVKLEPKPASDEAVERAKALFGDKLVIK